ncbi:Protein GLUTELIN PRECURSOR ACCUMULATION 3-like protein [Cladobotryum mycophilum]|uniref:Protein GLUTELIN ACCUMULATION 3-like protein n=1 Tax=Cladobotryum mycophilum TaxID=491253 RepID=A0ABR0SL35_9HYPO
MADSGKPPPNTSRSPVKTSHSHTNLRTVRSQKIVADHHLHHPTTTDRPETAEESDESDEEPPAPLPRSHTPSQLATRSTAANNQHRSHKVASEVALRQRAQSTSQVLPRPSTSSGIKKSSTLPLPSLPPAAEAPHDGGGGQIQPATAAVPAKPTRPLTPTVTRPPPGEHIPFPPLQDPKDAPDVAAAPPSGMYWSRAPVSGWPHSSLRAHTTTLIGSNVYIFGGCDSRACFNSMYILDADSFYWSVPRMVGDIPMPLRAMTCTAVGKKLVVFGGGDGPAYYNDIYVLDTVNFRWSRPRIVGDKLPSKRRAHTACLYKNGIYVFGGGDGIRALNDIWRLDVSDTSKMSWKLISSAEKTSQGSKDRRPKARGYHTANMVGGKLIIYGGSDGGECFDDVWVYDVDRHVWKSVHIPLTFRRLSHTSTIVGSYLFVIGGHDGNEYCNDVLLLNLVTMTWDKRRVYGLPPSGRGYHGTVLYDSRLLVIGGFDGSEVFGDVMVLELAVHAYYSQISHFTIDV